MKTIGDWLEELREEFADRQTWRERNPTEADFLAQPVRDAWSAGPEVDALLAQLRGDHQALLDTLDGMDAHRLAQFGQHLYSLGNTLALVAAAKARR